MGALAAAGATAFAVNLLGASVAAYCEELEAFGAAVLSEVNRWQPATPAAPDGA
jgi:hypothetical protein